MRRRLNRLMALGLAAVIVCSAAVPTSVYAAPPDGHGESHTVETHDKKEATCEEAGHETYYTCGDCNDGKKYKDAALEESYGDGEEVIPASHGTWRRMKGKAATCNDLGWKEYWQCNSCGAMSSTSDGENEITEKQENDEYAPHTVEKQDGTEATCGEDGVKTTWKCSVCDKEFLDEECEEEVSSADDKVEPATGHNDVELTRHVAVDATCQTDGNIEYYTCETCGGKFKDVNGTAFGKDESEVISKESDDVKHGTLRYYRGADATCAKDGTEEYWRCNDCGKLFSDKEGETEIDEPVIISKDDAEHDKELITHEGQEATCAEDGWETYWECGTCGQLFSDEAGKTEIDEPAVISKETASHENLTKHDEVDASCTEDGCDEYWECDVCGQMFADEDQKEQLTEKPVVSKDEGSHDEDLTAHEGQEATCAEDGWEAYWECEACGQLFSDQNGTTEIDEPVALLKGEAPHDEDLTAHEGQEATCAEDGWEAYWECETCGQLFSDEAGTVEIDEPAVLSKDEAPHAEDLTAHERQETTCAEDGWEAYWECETCGQLFSDEAGTVEIDEPVALSKDEAPHDEDLTAHEGQEATCAEDGWEAYWECETCGQLFSDEAGTVEIDEPVVIGKESAQHTLTDVVEASATCTITGTKAHQKCSLCEKIFINSVEAVTEELVIPTIAHEAVKTDAKEATATEAGNIAYWRCKECGKIFEDEALTKEITIDQTVVPALGEPLTDTQSFIQRLYEKCLGRTPEEAGMADWEQKLTSKEMSGAEVAYGIIFSEEYKLHQTTDEEFVDMLYQVIMGREADAEGRAYWLNKLENGMSREYVFRGFAESAEYTVICEDFGIDRGNVSLETYRDKNEGATGFVARLYTRMLGRRFDEDGLEYWCKNYVTGAQSIETIAMTGFLHSEEFNNLNLSDEEFITRMYQTFLNREPEAEGLAYWMDRLASGQETRDSIVYGFSQSEEFGDIKQAYGL